MPEQSQHDHDYDDQGNCEHDPMVLPLQAQIGPVMDARQFKMRTST
jgi:hypothetical protein